jgi:ATP-binding cassette subfamily B protein
LAAETVGAIDVVKAFSLEQIFAARFGRRNRDGQKEDLKANRLSARLGCTVDVWLSAASAIVIWYGAQSVLRGQLSPGDLLLFLFYTKRALRPAQDFAKYAARLAKAAAAGERVIHLLEQSAEAHDRPHAVPAARLRGAVRFADVSFEYEARRPVLSHVDFEVLAGQRVAVVGESGIGKSTLVGLLLRFYDPTQGSILIDGRDIRQYTLQSLRRQISIVLQESVLFSTSVRENIAFGAAEPTLERIENAARLANAHEFISVLPHGYDTLLGEKGASLSQGQRQRIAIARAIVRDAAIVVLDEPVSSLDEENRQCVTEALERLVEGRTTFLITHDLQLASRADLVFCLEQGRLSQCGSHAELVESGGRYATVYRLQRG